LFTSVEFPEFGSSSTEFGTVPFGSPLNMSLEKAGFPNYMRRPLALWLYAPDPLLAAVESLFESNLRRRSIKEGDYFVRIKDKRKV